MKRILTFELEKNGVELHVHGDEQGLKELALVLEGLLRSTTSDHAHLFTPDWGGEELSDEPQSENSSLVKKVTIHLWRS